MEHLTALKSDDSTALKELLNSVKIRLLKFDDLVAIGEPEYLKRYNPLVVELENNSNEALGTLLVTVIRTNSKIGARNRWTIPLDAHGLKPNSKAKYKLFAFDPFREEFEDINIRLTTSEDWADRSVSDKWAARATDFTKRLKWYNLV